jgi:hypothetical protein
VPTLREYVLTIRYFNISTVITGGFGGSSVSEGHAIIKDINNIIIVSYYSGTNANVLT